MLRFGTAGLRGPLRDGPDGMNVETVSRATAGVAAWLTNTGHGGGVVVVGRDARHGSAEFAVAAAEVFAAQGFSVLALPDPAPTPVLAFAVRQLRAVAGIQITASHNPAGDNGYKLYLADGAQLTAPADTDIEAAIAAVAEPIPRADPGTTTPDPAAAAQAGKEVVRRYLDRVASVPDRLGPAAAPSLSGAADMRVHEGKADAAAALRRCREQLRIVLTPLHGVGGEAAVTVLTAAGFGNVQVVAEQFAPDPDFPTVPYPNPEEPQAVQLLLTQAQALAADLAIALDPDADRCAVAVPGPQGWRMLRGDETGVLLADYVLAGLPKNAPDALVATTIVSSRLLAALAAARRVRYAETLTGFKWLARAGPGLVYAYEEAIGHCVDPGAVRDKDGLSAAVAAADLVARLQVQGRSLLDVLDDYALKFGLHAGAQVSVRLPDAAAAAATIARLRARPVHSIADVAVTCTDLAEAPGRLRTNALVFTGAGVRVVVRPSGTEPKLKCYLEVVLPVAHRSALTESKNIAAQRLSLLREFCDTL